MTGVMFFGSTLIVLAYMLGRRDERRQVKSAIRTALIARDRLLSSYDKAIADRRAREAEWVI